jgi:hypothetical protein
MLRVIGKFTVTPGTPVRLTSTQAKPGEKFACHGVLVQALKSNTGFVYVGEATMDKATMSGVYAQLAIPTANTVPSFTAALTASPNAVNLADLYLDGDVLGEGAIVSVLIA